MLKVYSFRAPGRALAATITVVAKHLSEAHKMAIDWCHDNNLPSTVALIKIRTFQPPMIVQAWNGDH